MANNFDFTESGYSESTPYNFNFGSDSAVYLFRILRGASNNVTSIWAESDAGIGTSRFYVADSGAGAAMSVVSLETDALLDFYTVSQAGGFGESLNNNDIEDINIT